MKKYFLLLITFIFCLELYADKIFQEFKDIPNPKTIDGGFVSNPDSLLSQEEYEALNFILKRIEDSSTAEVAVVAVRSIGTNETRDYIYRLFNHWGIGKRGKDNGLLLLIVKDQRSWDFETGYGLEATLPDGKLKFIGENFMVPKFKKDSMGVGIIEAMFVIEKLIAADSLYTSAIDKALNPLSTEEESVTYEDYFTNPSFLAAQNKELRTVSMVLFVAYLIIALIAFGIKLKNKTFHFTFSSNESDPSKVNILWWVFVYLALPALAPIYVYLNPIQDFYEYDDVARMGFIIFYVVLGFFVLEKKIRYSLRDKNRFVKDFYKSFINENTIGLVIFYIILFPFFFIPYLIWVQWKKMQIRKIPIPCEKCKSTMRKYSPNEKLSMLSEGQKTEDRLRSIEYDCWTCDSCQHKKILDYPNASTPYTTCKSCTFKTNKVYSVSTVTAATYSSSGTGRRDYECQHCKAKSSENYTTPMLVRSSSSSSTTYSSSGRSYSSSSSSRSSSSSSSSFGGGRSGGGGAGGRW